MNNFEENVGALKKENTSPKGTLSRFKDPCNKRFHELKKDVIMDLKTENNSLKHYHLKHQELSYQNKIKTKCMDKKL